MRCDRLRLGVAAASVLLVAGCGSAALTNEPSGGSGGTSTGAARPTMSSTGALAGAVTKLKLISQDSCQSAPAERVYPSCARFLAELRSAAGTLQNGADALPNSAAVRDTAAVVLDGAQSFDRDGCGSGPYDAGPAAAPRCVGDLSRIRQGVTTLLRLTAGGTGS